MGGKIIVMKKQTKIFYFHTPKTAGTTINSFFVDIFKNSIVHAESKSESLNDKFLNSYNFVSGHLSYTHMISMLDANWTKLITFREPYSHVVSHLCWIRKLADVGQEKRFNEHPAIFQKISLKMKSLDFSKPEEIIKLEKWLESINFYYLFDNQTIYLDFDKDISKAIQNLYTIEFVGIMEDIDLFFKIIDREFSFNKKRKIEKENINPDKYGFDLTNCKTREALLPFIKKDIIIYEEAKKIIYKQKELYFRDKV